MRIAPAFFLASICAPSPVRAQEPPVASSEATPPEQPAEPAVAPNPRMQRMQEIRADPKQWARYRGARHMVIAGAVNLSVAPVAGIIGGFWVLGLLLGEGSGIPADEWAAPAIFLGLGGATLVTGTTLLIVGMTRRKQMAEPRVALAPWGTPRGAGFSFGVRF